MSSYGTGVGCGTYEGQPEYRTRKLATAHTWTAYTVGTEGFGISVYYHFIPHRDTGWDLRIEDVIIEQRLSSPVETRRGRSSETARWLEL